MFVKIFNFSCVFHLVYTSKRYNFTTTTNTCFSILVTIDKHSVNLIIKKKYKLHTNCFDEKYGKVIYLMSTQMMDILSILYEPST